jgi:V8-like Glu-specific endopeptidase
VEGSTSRDTAVRNGRKAAPTEDRLRRRMRPAALVAAAVAVVSLGAACSGKAQAPQAGGSVHPGSGAAQPSASTSVIDSINGADLTHPVEESPAQIEQYWTEDKLQQATPPATPQNGGALVDAGDLGLNVTVEPTGPRDLAGGRLADSHSGNKWSMTGASAHDVGRLYYNFGKQPMVCSASIVTSKSKSLVATSGHCIHDPRTGVWATNILFIPGDRNGAAPYGRWTASRIWVTREFYTGAHVDAAGHSAGSGWAYDTAFMKMRPLNGQNIQTKLGSNGISFSGRYHSQMLILGYPTKAPFDGKTMRYCALSAIGRDSRMYSDWTMPCVMTPGASGGPWLTNYRNGAGYLISTSSVSNGKSLFGSFWGKVAYRLWLTADRG